MLDALDGTRLGHLGLGFVDWSARLRRGRRHRQRRRVATGPDESRPAGDAALGREQLGLRRLAVRVRSDNPAVAFYEKTGFREWQRVPIVARASAQGTEWHEAPDAAVREPSLVYMHYAAA